MINNTQDPVVGSRLRAYVACGWGLVVLFALVGALAGKTEASVYIATVTALMWTIGRITFEATLALRSLLPKGNEPPKDDGNKPLDPPTTP